MSDTFVNRRRFIQIAGAGAAAATQIGCGRKPSAVGQRLQVATTCELCPNQCPVIAEVFFKNLGLAFGSPNIVRHPTLCLSSVNLAYSMTYGTVPSFDLLNANYVIMAGANRFESFITPDTMDLIDSTMNRKTRLICLDPRFTVTASKADEWYPIKPRSDMAFCLAMLHV